MLAFAQSLEAIQHRAHHTGACIRAKLRAAIRLVSIERFKQPDRRVLQVIVEFDVVVRPSRIQLAGNHPRIRHMMRHQRLSRRLVAALAQRQPKCALACWRQLLEIGFIDRGHWLHPSVK